MFRFSTLLLGVGALANDETSLMQGLKPQDVKRRHDKNAVANLLESAKGMLTSGVTPDVVEFANATLTEIITNVLPAIRDASTVEQALLLEHFSAFETALDKLEQGVGEIYQLNQDQWEHNRDHIACRTQEAGLCEVKQQCDYELFSLWRCFVDEEAQLRQIEGELNGGHHWDEINGHHVSNSDPHGHFCNANGTTHEFRTGAVPIMRRFHEQWPVVVEAELNYDARVPQCLSHFNNLDDKTGVCDTHQENLEDVACQHRRKVQQVRSEFDCEWASAMYTYDLTEREVRLMMIDRIREYQTLSTVQCLLDRTTERNGRPCEEHTDEATQEITHCEEMRRGVDITFLELTFPCEARECGDLPDGIGPHLADDGSHLPGCDGPLVCPAIPPLCEFDTEGRIMQGRCRPVPPPHPCVEGEVFQGLETIPVADFHSPGGPFLSPIVGVPLHPDEDFQCAVDRDTGNSHCNRRPLCEACDLPVVSVCPVPDWVWAAYQTNSIRYNSIEYHEHAGNTPAPVTPAVCPSGWVQVGESGADIGGCGLQSCDDRYGTADEYHCSQSCDFLEECDGFSWAPAQGDRNHESTSVCTLYNSNMPTGTWSGSAGSVQVFCVREGSGSSSQCAPAALEKCQGNTPCIDLREGVNHHHFMYLNADGTAHVDGEANGINGGDARTWTCTRDGNGVGLVGTWNCPGFYSSVVTISPDFADDFTPDRDNDFIHVCALPDAVHTGYGQPCSEGTATIGGVPVCTVASDTANPWVLFGDIDDNVANFVASQVTSSATTSGLHNGDSVQVGTFSTGLIGTSGYSLDIGQFCSGGSCTAPFDLMIQYGDSDVFSHSEVGYSTTSGGFINNGHTAQGVVIGEHGMWGSNTDSPSGYYATFCAYNGGCRSNGNDFWTFSTHGVYPNAASSVVCGMYYGGSATPWKACPSGDNLHRMRYYVRSSDLAVALPAVQAQSD